MHQQPGALMARPADPGGDCEDGGRNSDTADCRKQMAPASPAPAPPAPAADAAGAGWVARCGVPPITLVSQLEELVALQSILGETEFRCVSVICVVV